MTPAVGGAFLCSGFVERCIYRPVGDESRVSGSITEKPHRGGPERGLQSCVCAQSSGRGQ